MGKHSAVLEYLTTKAWALEERVLQNLSRVVARHVEGGKLSQDEIDDIVAARDASRDGKPKAYEVRNGAAVIPISGVIAKHSSQVNGASQPRGTSTQAVAGLIQQALADASVERIVLAVDSPGGSVDGVQALADTIFQARGKKPITALADSTMASAAYWIASQADEVLATSDATVGSIGVYSVLPDYSRAAKNEGVDVHVVRHGQHKGTGVVGAPITSEQIAAIQREIDSYAELFVGAVARGRGISPTKAQALATGECWVGKHAVDAGLADGIATLEGLIGESASATNVAATAAEVGKPRSEDQSKEASRNPGGESVGGSAFTTLGDRDMTTQKDGPTTVAALEAQNPDLVKAIRETAHAEGVKKGTEAERLRASRIAKRATSSQVEMARKFIAEGTDADEATDRLLEDPRRNALDTRAALEVNAPPAIPPAASQNPQEDTPEAEWAKEFDSNPQLKALWGNKELYVIAQKQKADGLVKEVIQ